MLIYTPLSAKFKELNENSNQINDLCDLCSKSYLKELYENKRQYDFIGEIIKSKEPYIFIFIQNILTLYSSINEAGKEKINSNLFEKSKKYNKKNEKENIEMDNKIIEINTINTNKNKIIDVLNSNENKNQDERNKDIKVINKSAILQEEEKTQQNNLNIGINEPKINKEEKIVEEIRKIISPISNNINEMKELIYSINYFLKIIISVFMIFFVSIIIALILIFLYYYK